MPTAKDKAYLKEQLAKTDMLEVYYKPPPRTTYYNKHGVAIHNLPADGSSMVNYLKKGFTLTPPENPEPLESFGDTAIATPVETRSRDQMLDDLLDAKLVQKEKLAKEASDSFDEASQPIVAQEEAEDVQTGAVFSSESQTDEKGATMMCKVCTELFQGETTGKALAELGRHARSEHPKE